MDYFRVAIDGVAVLLGFVLLVGSFISKTIVWGRMFGAKPQKITWFGRIFLFVGGSITVFGFGLALLKELHVPVNRAWLEVGLPLGKAVMVVLFLPVVVPVVIASVSDSWRRGVNRTERVISICLAILFLFLIWETTPEIVRKGLSLFRDLGK